MAKISELPALLDPTGDETVVLLDGATTKRAPLAGLVDAAVAPAVATAQLAAATAMAASRYFPSRAAGEAGSEIDQLFTTDDGAGNLIAYRRTAGGSVEIARAVTPVSLASAEGAGAIGHRRPRRPAILSVAKQLDALGVIPQQWGWDGLKTSDATAYVQGAADYCTAGTQAGSYGALTDAPYAKGLVIPGHCRITAPIVVKERAVDRTNSRFEIVGVGGVLEADGDFTMITSDEEDMAAQGKLIPVAERLFFRDVRFLNRNQNNTGQLMSPKWLRVWFDGCEFKQVACLDSDRYAQEWLFHNCNVSDIPNNQAFFRAKGAYAVRATLFKAAFSGLAAQGVFQLFDPTFPDNTGVVNCSFSGAQYESSTGPFLRAGNCQNVSVRDLYTENNTGPILDFRCHTNGGTNRGILVQSCQFDARNENVADPSFFNVWWGPGGGDSISNTSRGGLYRNRPALTLADGTLYDPENPAHQLVRKFGVGCSVGSLRTANDFVGASKRYEMDLDGQIDLIPADPTMGPGWQYKRPITARRVVVYPVNGVREHCVALPYPELGLDVVVMNRLIEPTSIFTVMPSGSADGSKFRGGTVDVGLEQMPGQAVRYVCLEGGVWDRAGNLI